MSRRATPNPATLAVSSSSHTESNRPAYIPPGVRRTIRRYDNRQHETQRTDGLNPYPRLDSVRPGVAEHCPWATGLRHLPFTVDNEGQLRNAQGGRSLAWRR